MPANGLSQTFVYAVLIAVGTLGAISDAILNEWAKRGRLSWLIAAYAAWILVATLLGVVLRRGYFTFGTAVVLFLVSNSIAALVIDHQLLGGRLTGWGWIGIGFAVAALVCIELGRPHQRTDQPAQAGSRIQQLPSIGRVGSPLTHR
jgi:hypothetical protein